MGFLQSMVPARPGGDWLARLHSSAAPSRDDTAALQFADVLRARHAKLHPPPAAALPAAFRAAHCVAAAAAGACVCQSIYSPGKRGCERQAAAGGGRRLPCARAGGGKITGRKPARDPLRPCEGEAGPRWRRFYMVGHGVSHRMDLLVRLTRMAAVFGPSRGGAAAAGPATRPALGPRWPGRSGSSAPPTGRCGPM